MLRALTALACARAVLSAGPLFCGTCANGGPPPMQNTVMTLSCADAGAVIVESSLWASYGTPSTPPTCAYAAGACAAPTSLAVVSAACAGQSLCKIYPNTTTFADPCFGTPKVLAVEAACSSGAGAAACGVAPPPPPPPPPQNYTAVVTADFARQTATVRTEPSLQVVSQHFLFRDSPVAAQSWATLAQLGARHMRFVPWLPYAQAGVGQLMPPSAGMLCAPQSWVGGQTAPITLDCGAAGGAIASVDFASFGQPTGNCGAYAPSATCHAANSSAVVAALCVGKQSCVVPTAAGGAFGTPCAGETWLAVQLRCTNAALHTYWNFSLPDQFFSDFWQAASGDDSDPIINFSTQPTWLYSPNDYKWNANPDQPWDYSTRGTAAACNNTALGEYYGRLYAYFKLGRMTDEAGVVHTRPGGAANIQTLEVFNEVDYEHGYDPVAYTAAFDAVVRGVRAHADPGRTIRFVGLNLPNIDDTDKLVSWATYFLNASNHAADTTDALNFIGYHAYPTNGGYTPDPNTFSRMFDYVDDFIAGVKRVDAVIAALSPSTRTVLDETGTDMDGVLTPGLPPPANAPRYWVASAAYWAYFFARASNESATVAQVGASQLMDAPGQEPSVTLLDWSTGRGTARFWVIKMILDSVALNDGIYATNVTCNGADAGALFGMAFATPDQIKRVLLINKRNAWATVTLAGGKCGVVKVIDEATGLNPARDEACRPDGTVTLAPYATAVVLLQ